MDQKQKQRMQGVADEIMSKPGNIVGAAVNAQSDYVIKKEGEDGLRRVEQVMDELGYPFSFQDLDRFEMYPENYDVLRVYVAKEIFNWTDENIFAMGKNSLTISRVLRIAMGFVSLERTFSKAGFLWDKHFDFGELIPVEIDMEEKYMKLRMIDYDFHPIMQKYFRGYFSAVTEVTTGGEAYKAVHEACEQPDVRSCDVYTVWWRQDDKG